MTSCRKNDARDNPMILRPPPFESLVQQARLETNDSYPLIALSENITTNRIFPGCAGRLGIHGLMKSVCWSLVQSGTAQQEERTEEVGVTLDFSGVKVVPGAMVYADSDGVLIEQ